MGKIYYARNLKKNEVDKMLRKAEKMWRKIALRPPDQILVVDVKLPKILHNGRIIDLQKKYRNAQVVCSQVGPLLCLPYLARKGDDVVRKYAHFNKAPLILAVDPEDNTRMYLVWGEGMQVTDLGIEG
jgi:hypothetical protein